MAAAARARLEIDRTRLFDSLEAADRTAAVAVRRSVARAAPLIAAERDRTAARHRRVRDRLASGRRCGVERAALRAGRARVDSGGRAARGAGRVRAAGRVMRVRRAGEQ